MNLLELHAGSRSVGNVAESLGFNVFSVDWQKFDKIDLAIDIEQLTPNDIPFIPDVIWSSPDCTTYSIAAISTHRNCKEAKTDYAKKCDLVNINQWNLIKYYLELNPNLKYFVENPRGYMRKMQFVKGIPRTTVWYCRYGDMRAKPTDIFSNHIYSIFNPDGWNPKPMCFNNNKNCHHEEAPRGSKTGTQGKKGSYERSKIPKELCLEILKSTLNL